MALSLLFFRGGGTAAVVDTALDLTAVSGRHHISRLQKRRALQEGLPLNAEIAGAGLEVHTDGTIRVKIKSGGFITRDSDGLSVDEAILIQALIAERSLKTVEDKIDDLTAMMWSGLM